MLVIILSLHVVQVALSIRETIFSDVNRNFTVVALNELHQPPQAPWRNFEPRGGRSAFRVINWTVRVDCLSASRYSRVPSFVLVTSHIFVAVVVDTGYVGYFRINNPS